MAALLTAAILRSAPLLDNRFHPDESLYASFGLRIANWHDPLLAGVLVDKPPLFFYLLALSMGAVGGSELGARLPSFYASLLSVALVFVVGRRLYGPSVGLVAAWLLALSPFAILFSITLFLDPLVTTIILWAWWAAIRGRSGETALALGAAFAVKQTALLFVPLALALSLLRLPAKAAPREAAQIVVRTAALVILGLALAAAVSFGWDALRQYAIGFWTQGFADNVPGRLVRAGELLPRALAWVGWLHYLTASTPANLIAAAGVGLLLVSAWRQPSRFALADRLLTGFCVLYLGAYWLLAFNVWDRYLLPIVPLTFLLAARALVWIVRQLQRWAIAWIGLESPRKVPLQAFLSGIVVFAIAAMLIPPALAASRSQYPVGGDHGAYDGIDGAADFLRTVPEGSVLYDHWLSWEWGFYLYDGPVYVSWFPTPSELAVDLRAFGDSSPRFLAIPAWEADGEVRAAVQSAGFRLERVYTAYRRDGMVTINVYELKAPARE